MKHALKAVVFVMSMALASAWMPVVAWAASQPSLQAQIVRANDLMKAGKADEAWLVTDQALVQAEAMDNPDAVLPVLLLRQGLQTMRRDYPGAEATAKRGFALADGLGAPARLIGAAIAMNTTMMYLAWGRPAQAEPWAQRNLAGMEAIDRNGSLHKVALNFLAQVEEQLGKYALAQQHAEQEIALGVKLAPHNSARLVGELLWLADLRGKQGDLPNARTAYAQALPLQLSLIEKDNSASAFVSLARIYRGLGQAAEAKAALERAVAAAMAAGDVEPMVQSTAPAELARRQQASAKVSAWRWIGRLERDQGRLTEAEDAFRRVLAMSERMDGPGNADLPAKQVELADLLRSRGHWATAEAVYVSALAALDQTAGGSAATLPETLDGLARVLLAQGKRAEAEAALLREIDLYELYIASEHPQLVPALELLAEMLAATDRAADARVALARANAIREIKR